MRLTGLVPVISSRHYMCPRDMNGRDMNGRDMIGDDDAGI